jgi:hypothetical protein
MLIYDDSKDKFCLAVYIEFKAIRLHFSQIQTNCSVLKQQEQCYARARFADLCPRMPIPVVSRVRNQKMSSCHHKPEDACLPSQDEETGTKKRYSESECATKHKTLCS